ncbi:HesA/MoeB/ThiF family protein [Alicyclobacillus sp. TC]|uniref:Molybdopterin/thiamine biosynthesis adenylyltransferase n=1 Tax=Alicyclobacillus tolerans TaxID=90970 RepID=A0ABT9LZK5_9BACL|nr:MULTISPECIES: ThiF family adenylyltransferase [Alicyclobacillus]MDP9729561.1 molybdopterin/thiamine biosynthesis adenylyltransferase [Alicyclobacillus tengchongensis]QRF23540.1 HesA/MoeB/ThiF family protein [Alicyclobacillus sp. TC]
MSNEKKYTLNPYCVISQIEDGSVLFNLSKENAVNLTNLALLEILLSSRGKFLDIEQLKQIASSSEISNLIEKHILLPYEFSDSDIQNILSRQMGFLSFLGKPFDLQNELQKARIVIFGCGGLGSHVAWYLTTMGVGHLTLIDYDVVELTNLNRQLLYNVYDLGIPKAKVLANKLSNINPDIQIESKIVRIENFSSVFELISGADLVIKAIDTPESVMTWLNKACVLQGIPYIAGGFAETSGIVGPIYIPNKSLCFDCIGSPQGKRLAGLGTSLSPIVGAVASQIALYAVKIIWRLDNHLVNKFFTYEFGTSSWYEAQLESFKICPTCGHSAYRPKPKIVINWTTIMVFLFSAIMTFLQFDSHKYYWGICGLLLLIFVTSTYSYRGNFVQTFRRLVVDGAVFSVPPLVVNAYRSYKGLYQHFTFVTILNSIQTLFILILESAIAYTTLLLVITCFSYVIHILGLHSSKKLNNSTTTLRG